MKSTRFGVYVFCLFAVTGCSGFARPPEFKGAVYAAPGRPPDFTLPSTRGGDFTLSDQEDVVTLIFFGYTFCPDVCPQTLGLVRTALNRLDDAERSRIELVFVSVDPARDNLAILEGYLARFDPSFLGVRPDPEQLEKLIGDYDAYVEPEPQDPESAGYEVSHTSVIYVVDKSGNLRLGFFSGMSPEEIAHDLRILIDE
ncbi:MAG TPA: SCO family protein [Anaerolineales bacterium]|nr:SCO family protein [Anaerolineales bacterium]